MKDLVLGKEVSRVTADTFSTCEDLERVTILNPRLMLPEGVFGAWPHVIIRAHAGSFAEFYAKKHGHPFEKL